MIHVLSYGMGNIKSLSNALEHLGERVVLVSKETDFSEIIHLIIPGVGSFKV